MITEAYDAKGTKYKVGMEAILGKDINKWYITGIELGDDGKVSKLYFINNKLNEMEQLTSTRNIKLTGYFRPEFVKIAKELDKR